MQTAIVNIILGLGIFLFCGFFSAIFLKRFFPKIHIFTDNFQLNTKTFNYFGWLLGLTGLSFSIILYCFRLYQGHLHSESYIESQKELQKQQTSVQIDSIIKEKEKVNNFLLDLLKIEEKRLDTSIEKKEVYLTPIDETSSHKIDTVKLLNDKIINLKNYLSSQPNLPGIKDSIKTYIANSKQKLFNAKDLKHGYIYGGMCDSTGWVQTNLSNVTHNGKCPIKGDKIVCIKPVYIRSGESHEVAEKKGWVNRELLGILDAKKEIIVKRVVVLPKGYIWIEF